MTTDPNWLLSTIAQSSAALVGIIGGLLVSRIVGLASERSALRRQASELVERQRRIAEDLDPLEEQLRVTVEEGFRRQAIDKAVDDPDMTADQLVEQGGWHESWNDVLTPLAEEIVENVGEAYDRCEACADQPIDPDRISELVDVPPGQEDVYKAVAREVRRSQMGHLAPLEAALAPGRSTASILMPSLVAPSAPGVDTATRRQALRDADGLVEIQLATVRTSLSRIGDVGALLPTLLALGAFAGVGVIQPVIMLAWRPVPSSWPWRLWVVVSFAAALGALLWFLWREVRTLTRREPEAEPRSDAVDACTGVAHPDQPLGSGAGVAGRGASVSRWRDGSGSRLLLQGPQPIDQVGRLVHREQQHLHDLDGEFELVLADVVVLLWRRRGRRRCPAAGVRRARRAAQRGARPSCPVP